MTVTALMCEQVITAQKMGFTDCDLNFVARELMKENTAMDKESFIPMLKDAHAEIMQKIIDDGRWFEFNALMGGGVPSEQQCLFGV